MKIKQFGIVISMMILVVLFFCGCVRSDKTGNTPGEFGTTENDKATQESTEQTSPISVQTPTQEVSPVKPSIPEPPPESMSSAVPLESDGNDRTTQENTEQTSPISVQTPTQEVSPINPSFPEPSPESTPSAVPLKLNRDYIIIKGSEYSTSLEELSIWNSRTDRL